MRTHFCLSIKKHSHFIWPEFTLYIFNGCQQNVRISIVKFPNKKCTFQRSPCTISVCALIKLKNQINLWDWIYFFHVAPELVHETFVRAEVRVRFVNFCLKWIISVSFRLKLNLLHFDSSGIDAIFKLIYAKYSDFYIIIILILNCVVYSLCYWNYGITDFVSEIRLKFNVKWKYYFSSARKTSILG